MSTTPDPLRRSQFDITPDTHVKMSTEKFLSIIALVVGLVASVVGVYLGLSHDIHDHVNDTNVHLDRDYMKDHGRPVGKWDLDVVHTETNQRLDGMKKELEQQHDLLIQSLQQRRR